MFLANLRFLCYLLVVKENLPFFCGSILTCVTDIYGNLRDCFRDIEISALQPIFLVFRLCLLLMFLPFYNIQLRPPFIWYALTKYLLCAMTPSKLGGYFSEGNQSSNFHRHYHSDTHTQLHQHIYFQIYRHCRNTLLVCGTTYSLLPIQLLQWFLPLVRPSDSLIVHLSANQLSSYGFAIKIQRWWGAILPVTSVDGNGTPEYKQFFL